MRSLGTKPFGRGSLAGAMAWLVATALALAALYRPGFLALREGRGWVTLAFLLATAVAVGAVCTLVTGARKALPLWIWAVPLVLLGASLLRMGPPAPGGLPGNYRVLTLGMDGATWEVIDRLADDGHLPNLTRLREEGATGILHAAEPTLSPRVWTTLASGVDPPAHGALDFYATQESIRVPRLWEIVEREGGKILLWRWLLTWPPVPSNGVIVPGWMARGPETWPPDLQFLSTLAGANDGSDGGLLSASWQAYRNGLRLPTLVQAASLAAWMRLRRPDERLIPPRVDQVEGEIFSDLFLYLARRWGPDFGALVLYGTDAMAHRYWQDFEPHHFPDSEPPEPRVAEAIPDAYRLADRVLGRLFQVADENTIVVVVSDHGTGPREGGLHRYVTRSENLLRLLRLDTLRAFTVGVRTFVRDPDYQPTAEAPDPPFVGIVRNLSIEGEPLFEVTAREDDAYEITVASDPLPGARVQLPAGAQETAVEIERLVKETDFSGSHRGEGILGLWGGPIAAGASLEHATLVDFAPTVLALLGCPLSDELAGRVLEEALQPGAVRNLRISRVPSYGDPKHLGQEGASDAVDEELNERLRALGYLQ